MRDCTAYNKAVARPASLSTSQVVTAALDLLDRRGPEAVSIRTLAAELGVTPNALYTYVDSREALERLLADAVLAEIVRVRERADQPPRRRVEQTCERARVVLLRHPGAARLLMTAPMDGPHALALGEHLLADLVDAGLDPEEASRAAYGLIVWVVGFTALAVAETDGTAPLPSERARVAERRRGLAALSAGAEGHPLTWATREVAATWVGKAQFTWGVARMLDGIGI